MQPRVFSLDGTLILETMNALIVEKESGETTGMLRFMCRKTHDPRKRYEEAIQFLASAYYQYPHNFSDLLSATFAADSTVATRLLDLERCRLEFEQFGQRYNLPCEVITLAPDHHRFEATFWHNKLFNDALPPGVRILSFRPDWAEAEADPDP